jgi:hypothetical protein
MPNYDPKVPKAKLKAKKLILEWTAKGETLVWIAKNIDGVPHRDTIYGWLNELKGTFLDDFRRAKIAAVEPRLDKMWDLIDETVEGAKTQELNNVAVQAVRLKIDTEKWYAARLAPRLYGQMLVENYEEGQPAAVSLVFAPPPKKDD